MVVEEEDRDGEMVVAYSVKVATCGITPSMAQGIGIIGQSIPQYYFHRPLSALLAPALRAGFALDGLEEPAFDQPRQSSRPFDCSNYPEIPPVLAARVRLLSTQSAKIRMYTCAPVNVYTSDIKVKNCVVTSPTASTQDRSKELGPRGRLGRGTAAANDVRTSFGQSEEVV